MFVIYCYKYLQLIHGSMVMVFSAQCLACDPFNRRNGVLSLLVLLLFGKNYPKLRTRENHSRRCTLVVRAS